MTDPHNLQRFIDAQAHAIDKARAELKRGVKQSHWMWFIFPQMRGLGASETADLYGIASIGEARAYLAHPVLGPRLRELTELVNAIDGSSADDIFGFPDNLKFRSCMTLFAKVTEDNSEFEDALRRYFRGEPDQLTIELLKCAL